MFDYDRAILSETRDQVWPGIKSKSRVVIEGLLALGFACEVYRRRGMDLTSTGELAFNGGTALLCGLAAFMVLHLGFAWMFAPRRIFNRQRSEIAELTTRAETAECAGREKAVQRKAPNDAIEILENAVTRVRTLSLGEAYLVLSCAASECLKPCVSSGLAFLYERLQKCDIAWTSVRQQLLDHVSPSLNLLRNGDKGCLLEKYLGP